MGSTQIATQGLGANLLFYMKGVGAGMGEVRASFGNYKVQDISFMGKVTPTTQNASTGNMAILTVMAANCQFENVSVSNFGTGMQALDCHDNDDIILVIGNCLMGYNIQFQNNSAPNAFSFFGYQISGCAWYGLYRLEAGMLDWNGGTIGDNDGDTWATKHG